MRERKAACSSHAGSREERGPRRRHGASHGGARGDSRRSSATAGTWSSHRHVRHLFCPKSVAGPVPAPWATFCAAPNMTAASCLSISLITLFTSSNSSRYEISRIHRSSCFLLTLNATRHTEGETSPSLHLEGCSTQTPSFEGSNECDASC